MFLGLVHTLDKSSPEINIVVLSLTIIQHKNDWLIILSYTFSLNDVDAMAGENFRRIYSFIIKPDGNVIQFRMLVNKRRARISVGFTPSL